MAPKKERQYAFEIDMHCTWCCEYWYNLLEVYLLDYGYDTYFGISKSDDLLKIKLAKWHGDVDCLRSRNVKSAFHCMTDALCENGFRCKTDVDDDGISIYEQLERCIDFQVDENRSDLFIIFVLFEVCETSRKYPN